jgi:hypothetical protein
MSSGHEGDRVNQSIRSWLRLAAAILLLCTSISAWSFGLRCGPRVISTGMLETQVQGACGAPFWTDEYSSLEIFGAGGPIEEQREINWQVWYYNFGSSSLMQRLTFRDGYLQKIESLGYGVDEIGASCVPALVARGLTTGELYARCGEPASRQRSDGALLRRVPGALFAHEDRREEWLYDDGSGYLARYFITNSRVMGADRFPR